MSVFFNCWKVDFIRRSDTPWDNFRRGYFNAPMSKALIRLLAISFGYIWFWTIEISDIDFFFSPSVKEDVKESLTFKNFSWAACCWRSSQSSVTNKSLLGLKFIFPFRSIAIRRLVQSVRLFTHCWRVNSWFHTSAKGMNSEMQTASLRTLIRIALSISYNDNITLRTPPCVCIWPTIQTKLKKKKKSPIKTWSLYNKKSMCIYLPIFASRVWHKVDF